ncbi:glycosyltransferase [Bacteroides sp. 51]|uniref:glycosyltransferase n=1 Tax=Bacteroides sp. 51 TaxID=2302938 RepID=UPI0013D0826A|nr:glycosyltransferase [Bacteroides sp. 51]NDV81634.1 glycosyltransferase [Bacteroides sp. 51]
MTHPRVSIVMCTYNGEQFLREQLDSIIGQTYPIYELIVQDDGSVDGTIEIIREYAERYAFIKLFTNERQLGYNQNFLSAILKAKGDAIAISDQDDIWHTQKIEKQIEKLNEGHSMVFHNSLLFEESPHTILSERHKEEPVVSELRLILKPFIPGHECLFTRKALPIIKRLYQQEPNLAYAYITALVCITLGPISYINEGLVYWRRHPEAATRKNKSKTYSAFHGILISFAALFQQRKRNIPQRYFNVIYALPFKTVAAQKVIVYMQGNTIQILKACFVCGRHVSAFFKKISIRNRIKALFTPLHLLRDAGFLIRS